MLPIVPAAVHKDGSTGMALMVSYCSGDILGKTLGETIEKIRAFVRLMQ
jgi:hypothetical protein